MKKNKHKFFVLYGASGAGKSTLLELIKKMKGCSTHQKVTTRPTRKGEKKDGITELKFSKNLVPDEYELIYKFCGHYYGIRKDLIEKAIKNNEYHFIILGDVENIKKFNKIHPNSVNIYIHCDPNQIPKRLMKRDSLILKKRQKRIKQQYKDFMKNNTLFHHVLINLWDLKYMKRQIINVIKLYQQEPVVA